MADSRVLVVGDLNPDLVLHGDVVPRFGQAEQLLDSAVWTIGGSAAIVAHGLARLGRPVSLAAAVGKDAFGARLCDELGTASVDVTSVAARDDSPTALTVALCRADDRAMLTLPGALPTLTLDEVLDAIAARPDLAHVHVASPFLVPLEGRLRELLVAVRARGLTVSLDTNDDPAGGWRGIAELLPYVDVLLPNRREVLALAGTADVADAAQALAALGPLVVVKDGAAGAFAVSASDAAVHVGASPVDVVDSTGAGDTFDAAFVDAWLDARPLEQCLERAVRAGSFAVTAVGGTAGQPRTEDIDASENQL